MESTTENREGKKVLLGCLLLVIFIMGLQGNCRSIFIIPVTTYYGWTRSAFSLGTSISSIAGLIFAMNSWKVYQRFDVVDTVKVGAVLSTIAYTGLAFADQLWKIYVLYFIMGFAMRMTCTLPVNLLMAEWFPDNMNRAIGIAMMGSGISGMLFNPVINAIMLKWDFKMAYLCMGACMGIFSFIAAFLLLKRNPETLAAERNERLTKKKEPVKVNIFQPKFMLLCCAALFISACSNGINNTLNPYLQDIGYSQTFAATIQSLSQGAMAAGKILLGVVIDRRGLKTAMWTSFSADMLGLVGMIFFMGDIFLIFPFIALFLGCPFNTVAMSSIAAEIEGPRMRAAYLGKINAVVSMSNVFTPYLMAWVYDNMGSYVPYYWACAICLALSSLCITPAFRIKTYEPEAL